MIAVSSKTSRAMIAQRIDELHAWGRVVGLETQRSIVPRKMMEFEPDRVQTSLGITSNVHSLVFDEICCAGVRTHFVREAGTKA